jgi:hypothetical protein
MSQNQAQESYLGFNGVLKKSIGEGISSAVGSQTLVAVDFYLGREVATKDIVRYTRALERMFTVGSKLIEDRCAQALFSNLKIRFEPKNNFKLSDYVEDAKKKWLSGDSFTHRAPR